MLKILWLAKGERGLARDVGMGLQHGSSSLFLTTQVSVFVFVFVSVFVSVFISVFVSVFVICICICICIYISKRRVDGAAAWIKLPFLTTPISLCSIHPLPQPSNIFSPPPAHYQRLDFAL